jgi:hypothetical protein
MHYLIVTVNLIKYDSSFLHFNKEAEPVSLLVSSSSHLALSAAFFPGRGTRFRKISFFKKAQNILARENK